MATFTATVRVVHVEQWEVEAEDEAEARRKINDMDPDVIDDETGGEVVDVEVYAVRRVD